MEATAYQVDRQGWPPGPWDGEPDRVDFVHAGFACMIIRNRLGAWCGYVGVPHAHPAYGRGYDDVDVDVHGGLTYADHCSGHICHVPQPGMPDDVWWLGFDCAHAFDTTPGMLMYHARYAGEGNISYRHPDESYKDQAYAMAETQSLAAQLASNKVE